MADTYKYELSPMVGYNFAEGNLGIQDNGYLSGGLEFQINFDDSKISPEVALYFAPTVDYRDGNRARVARGAFNALYTFDKTHTIIPFAKVGFGFEEFINNRLGNEDNYFLNTGGGIKMDLNRELALKLEAIYMFKPATTHAGYADNNLMTMVGLSYSFGSHITRVSEHLATDTTVPQTKRVSSNPRQKSKQSKAKIIPVVSQEQNTTSSIEHKEKSVKPSSDSDGDGILNKNDLCPQTPLETAVNENGCPVQTTLNIRFKKNSYHIKQYYLPSIDSYVALLRKHPNYTLHISGYTDNTGDASYNKLLSEKRANEVLKLLISRGANPSQLSAEGMGEANPVADNTTKAGRLQNRRIEAVFTKN